MLGLELGGGPVRGRFVRQRRDAGTHPRLDGVVGDVLQRLDRGLGGVGGLDGARDRLARLLDQALGGVLLRYLVGRRVLRLQLGLHGIRGLRGGARLGEGRLGVLIGRRCRGLRLGRRLGCRRGDLQRLIGLGGRVGHRGLHLAEIRGDLFDRGLRPVQFRREIGCLLRHRIHIGTHARHGILHILNAFAGLRAEGFEIGADGIGLGLGGVRRGLRGLEIGLGLLTDGVDGRLDLSCLRVHLVETVVDAVDLLLGLINAGLHLFELLLVLGLGVLYGVDRLLIGVCGILSVIGRVLRVVGGVLSVIGLLRGVIGHLFDVADLNRLILSRLIKRTDGVQRMIDVRIQLLDAFALLSGQRVDRYAKRVGGLARIAHVDVHGVEQHVFVDAVRNASDSHQLAGDQWRISLLIQRKINGFDLDRGKDLGFGFQIGSRFFDKFVNVGNFAEILGIFDISVLFDSLLIIQDITLLDQSGIRTLVVGKSGKVDIGARFGFVVTIRVYRCRRTNRGVKIR